MQVTGDSMAPTLLDGDTVLVDTSRRQPNPPGIFVLDDGIALVAKRLEHIAGSEPPEIRVISDNRRYPEYSRTADEVHIVGRICWFGREM
jgi:phage repressor protein C with HTH and peptisase S24 domain